MTLTHTHTLPPSPKSLPPCPPPFLSKPHTNTVIASFALTTIGSIAVRAFETQLMLYNRGLSLNHLHPTTSQHTPTKKMKTHRTWRNVCLYSENVSLQGSVPSRDTGLMFPPCFSRLYFELFLPFLPSSLLQCWFISVFHHANVYFVFPLLLSISGGGLRSGV